MLLTEGTWIYKNIAMPIYQLLRVLFNIFQKLKYTNICFVQMLFRELVRCFTNQIPINICFKILPDNLIAIKNIQTEAEPG